MHSDHPEGPRFAFKEDRHARVFLCSHVAAGAPVLYVAHDSDGDWQFLCGEEHDPESGEKPVVQCLEHVVARDATLNDLAGLCTSHRAERAAPGAPWEITDEAEEFIRTSVERHGWAVQLIGEGSNGEPGFAYTIGLFENWKHPELIVVGLAQETMHAVLNEIGERVRQGVRHAAGATLKDVLQGYDVRLRGVTNPKSYREHVGYALWFYKGARFPLLQVIWPDKDGRFPGEPEAAAFLQKLQPLLP